MAKKQYTGAKVTILALAGAAVMYGTAWLSANAQPWATTSTTTATAPVSTNASNISAASNTLQPVQPAAPRAKRSRSS